MRHVKKGAPAAKASRSVLLTAKVLPPPTPGCFLGLVILKDFKSFAPELVILKGIKTRFSELLILKELRCENGGYADAGAETAMVTGNDRESRLASARGAGTCSSGLMQKLSTVGTSLSIRWTYRSCVGFR